LVDTLFRFTTGETTDIGALADTEKIEFNSGSVPDAFGRTISCRFRMTRDINVHPNPRRELDQIQDSLLGVLDVWVTGYFVNRSITKGPINLYNWSRERATSPPQYPFGRFGLIIDNFASGLLNETPNSTRGYILYDIDVQDVDNPRDKMPFTAKFYLNGKPVSKALP